MQGGTSDTAKGSISRKNAFLVENDETQSNNDNDGKGSASHDQCKRAILNYGDDDDSTMVVDEDQEDSFFQLNIMWSASAAINLNLSPLPTDAIPSVGSVGLVTLVGKKQEDFE